MKKFHKIQYVNHFYVLGVTKFDFDVNLTLISKLRHLGKGNENEHDKNYNIDIIA